MSASHQLLVSFEGTSVREGNLLADSLAEHLGHSDASIETKRHRPDKSTMDFGATLVLIFGAPAVVAIAKGMEAWLKKHHDASLTIRGQDGEIILKNVTAREAIDLAKLKLR